MTISRLTNKCRYGECGEGYRNRCNLRNEIRDYPEDGICYDETELWESEAYIGETKDFETCRDCVTPIGFMGEMADNFGGRIGECGLCKQCLDIDITEFIFSFYPARMGRKKYSKERNLCY